MLNILRKRAQSTVIQAVVLIIAVVFIFWGVGTNLGNRRNTLATVNGVEIPAEDFRRSYDSAVENMRAQFGGNIPQGFLESLNLERQVLDQLIQAEILRQGGREMGISVSGRAVQDEIKSMSVFQAGGQFDLTRYKAVLEQNRMNPTSFEAGLEKDLLVRDVSRAIEGFAVVTDGEITSRHNASNEKVRIAYSVFKGVDLEGTVEVNEQDLAAWFEKHKNDYLSEPKIQLQYLFFNAEDDLAQVQVSEETLKERYEAEKERYFQPEQRRARHILLRVAEGEDEKTRAEKKKKAEEILAQAKAGKDFAELAKKHSEDSSAKNGGDLGFFSKGAMVESFDNAVFQMQPGEISAVVETVFGYHLIKLEEVRTATTRSFEQVQAELADQVKRQEGKGLTFTRASQAYEDIIKAGSLAKYREGHQDAVKETGLFARSEPPPAPVNDPRFLQAAFALNKGELSSITETGQGYAILFVTEVEAPTAPELSAVRDKVVAAFRKEKGGELAKSRAEELLKGAHEKKSLAGAAPEGVAVQESVLIGRTDPASEGQPPGQVVQQAFALSLHDALPTQPILIGDAYYVFQLLERQREEKPLDEAGRKQLQEQALAVARNGLMTDWLTWMRGRTETWVNEDLLK